jgi:hypothetical protein
MATIEEDLNALFGRGPNDPLLTQYSLDAYIESLRLGRTPLNREDLLSYVQYKQRFGDLAPYLGMTLSDAFERFLTKRLGAISIPGRLLRKLAENGDIVSKNRATPIDRLPQDLEEVWASLQRTVDANEYYYKVYEGVERHIRRRIEKVTSFSLPNVPIETFIRYASVSALQFNNVGIQYPSVDTEWIRKLYNGINALKTAGNVDLYCIERMYPLLYVCGLGRIAFPDDRVHAIVPLARRVFESYAAPMGAVKDKDDIRNLDTDIFGACRDLSAANVSYGISLLLDRYNRVEPQTRWWNMILLSPEESTQLSVETYDRKRDDFVPFITPIIGNVLETLTRDTPNGFDALASGSNYRRVLVLPINTNRRPDSPVVGPKETAHWILVIVVITPWDVNATQLYAFDSLSTGESDSILGESGRKAVDRLRENLKLLPGQRFFDNVTEHGFVKPQGQKGGTLECGGRVLAVMDLFFAMLDGFVTANETTAQKSLDWVAQLDNNLCQTPLDVMETRTTNLVSVLKSTLQRYTKVGSSDFIKFLAESPSNPAFRVNRGGVDNGSLNLALFQQHLQQVSDETLEVLKPDPTRLLMQLVSIVSIHQAPAYTANVDAFLGSPELQVYLKYLKDHLRAIIPRGIGDIYALFFMDVLNSGSLKTAGPLLDGHDFRALFDQVDLTRVSDKIWKDTNAEFGLDANPLGPYFASQLDHVVAFIEESGQLDTWIFTKHNGWSRYRGFQDSALLAKIVDLAVVRKQAPQIQRPPQVSDAAFDYIGEFYKEMSLDYYAGDAEWQKIMTLAAGLPMPDARDTTDDMRFKHNTITSAMVYFLNERISYVLRAQLDVRVRDSGIHMVFVEYQKYHPNAIIAISPQDIAAAKDRISRAFDKDGYLLDEPGTRYSVDSLTAGLPPALFAYSPWATFDKLKTTIANVLKEARNYYLDPNDEGGVVRVFLDRPFVMTLDEVLKSHHMVTGDDLYRFTNGFAQTLDTWDKNPVGLNPSSAERVALHQWAALVTLANLTWNDEWYNTFLVSDAATQKGIINEIAVWKQWKTNTNIIRWMTLLDDYKKVFRSPEAEMQLLRDAYNNNVDNWNRLYEQVQAKTADLKKNAIALAMAIADPQTYYTRDPSIEGWLMVEEHPALLAAVYTNIGATLQNEPTFRRAIVELQAARYALDKAIRDNFKLDTYAGLIQSNPALASADFDAIERKYDILGGRPDLKTDDYVAALILEIKRTMGVRWHVDEYEDRETRNTYFGVVDNDPLDIDVLDTSIFGGDPIQGAPLDALSSEVKRLQEDLIVPLQRELDFVKNQLELHVRIPAASIPIIKSEVDQRQTLLQTLIAGKVAIEKEIFSQTRPRFVELPTLPAPNVEKYLARVEEAFKKVPLEPVSYGRIPRGFSAQEWRDNPDYRIVAESQQLKQRREYAEFVAFSNARREYMRESRRESLGINYRGSRNPLY